LALDAGALALEPPPPVDYVRWAESNIAFTERESPFPGPYNRTMFPYFDEPLRALSPDDPCRVVTIESSAQIGKAAAGNIFIAGSIAMDSADILVTHPTEDNARRWSKLKLAPLLRGTAVLTKLFRSGRAMVLTRSYTRKRRWSRAQS
jgi:phage terminase large subunit GpA-like protein